VCVCISKLFFPFFSSFFRRRVDWLRNLEIKKEEYLRDIYSCFSLLDGLLYIIRWRSTRKEEKGYRIFIFLFLVDCTFPSYRNRRSRLLQGEYITHSSMFFLGFGIPLFFGGEGRKLGNNTTRSPNHKKKKKIGRQTEHSSLSLEAIQSPVPSWWRAYWILHAVYVDYSTPCAGLGWLGWLWCYSSRKTVKIIDTQCI
jgi:hypothetical protein